jgi:transcriptional regulatory protein RtcR
LYGIFGVFRRGTSASRMATLADGGRIDVSAVEYELQRLQQRNQHHASNHGFAKAELQHPHWLALKETIDSFDQVQLAYVIQVCLLAHNLSNAGRALFEHSRKKKKMSNDADRLRKYLAKFDLIFAQIKEW